MKEREEGKNRRKLSEKVIFMLRSSQALLLRFSDKNIKTLEWLETVA
jgi:hypothetical protein